MELFHKFQNKGFQFSLDLLAYLDANGTISKQEVAKLSRASGLEYPDQVVVPLLNHHILQTCDQGYALSSAFSTFQLPMSGLERDYLSFILGLPLCSVFLDQDTQGVLSTLGDADTLEGLQWYAPPQRTQVTHTLLRPLLQGARESRLVAYTCQGQKAQGLPYRLVYDVYDQQWQVFLYHMDSQTMERLALQDFQTMDLLDKVVKIAPTQLQQAMDARLAPEPIVLTVSKERGALERCFLAFQHREFLETRQLGGDTYRLSFQYDVAEVDEILHRLLYLGPCVTLQEPPHLRTQLLALIDQALTQLEL